MTDLRLNRTRTPLLAALTLLPAVLFAAAYLARRAPEELKALEPTGRGTLKGKVTLDGDLPAKTSRMLCAATVSIRRRTSRTAEPRCGVNKVRSSASSAGEICRGRR